MRILFLSQYFPPEVNAPANRTFEHARRWVADGHDVTVITGVPNHPNGVLFPGYRNRWLQQEVCEGIRVLRTWTYLTPNRGFLRRTLNYLLFAAMAVVTSLRVSRPDVVVATSPQFFCGVAGALAALLKRRPFVLEVRDLWPDSILQLGQLRSRPVARFLVLLEGLLYRRSAGIVVTASSFADHVAARGVDRDRIVHVPNGIDPRVFRALPPDRALQRRHDLEGKFVVSYIGTLGLAHGLATVLDAAERLRDEPELQFLLIGDGADREQLEEEAARRELDNLRFLGLLPRAEIPAWIASSDVLLVMLRDLPVFETVIPSKLFECLAHERPVVLAAPRRGESRRLVEEAKAAFAIDAENVAQLVETLLRIRSHPQEAAARARAGREWVESHFRRDELARRMAAFLARIAEADA
jgi:glycosyltransferase involved in cell wall biosynthesis